MSTFFFFYYTVLIKSIILQRQDVLNSQKMVRTKKWSFGKNKSEQLVTDNSINQFVTASIGDAVIQ